ncbi:MAG TPA: carboxylating nicotinate-nucleotide diphosphorylase [Desulfobacteraceae bacterium]|nr:carboxylating nicotinate-nucleotide diphosphorylase [Desulfobacteraceae bacterium]
MDALTELISLALYEDSGLGDLTSESLLDRNEQGKGIIVAKEPFIVAGLDVAEKVFKTVDATVATEALFPDGAPVSSGDTVFKVQGNLVSMLKGERVALNFVQRLSGIATLTRTYVERMDNPKVRLCDTRKTIPGWRVVEKAAVRAGGAFNHRMSLYDGILIKDNHAAVAGGVKNAVLAVKSRVSHLMKIEVETSTLDEVKEAVAAGADVIMLDNMEIPEIEQAVDYIKGRAVVEASGNVTLENIARLAKTGVDVISSGALTHQARAVDMSMGITRGSAACDGG